MSPASINQVNNIRLETFVRFLAIIVLRISYCVSRILLVFYAIFITHDELFPSILAMVHRILPQLQIFQVYAGAPGHGAERVLDSFDL